ncbi:MAG: fused MFS/spermidine synthase [Terriglobales bacterium]
MRPILALMGFTAVIAQIVLMRELIVVFQGNEVSLGVMLASWLLWTAAGSIGFGSLASRHRHGGAFLAALQVLLALVLPLTILAVRTSKAAFSLTPGELLGPGPMFLTCLATLSLLCIISGGMFSVGSGVYADSTGSSSAHATGSVYLFEAVGSGLGGLLASSLLIRYFNSFQIAIFLSLLNLGSAVLLVRGFQFRRALVMVLLAALAFADCHLSRYLESASLAQLWHGFRLVTTHNSVYGNLAVVETEGSRSLYESGLVFATAPDPATAEESVHFALLEHPSPKTLLLIGGGLGGGLQQALQHVTLQRVDYVELDPAILDLAERLFPTEWAPARSDPRVNVHTADGRLFLKTTQRSFDVIIVNLPDPQTAQLNRFYTLEFFRGVAAKLNAGGVFSFQLHGSENYISPELADFLRCIHKTLGMVFAHVTIIPGDTIHFVATNQSETLAADVPELLLRLRSRHLATQYVREYYIPFRLSPDRVHDLEEQIRVETSTPVNRDFAPVAYYFDVVLWSKQFNPEYRRIFQNIARIPFLNLAAWTAGVVFALTLALARLTRGQPRLKAAAGFSVVVMGWTLIGLEVFLLLGFQAIYGYVYQQLAIVIAAFMAGMATGSWCGLRHCGEETAAWDRQVRGMTGVQLLAAIAPLVLVALFAALSEVHTRAGLFVTTELAFPLLALLSGLLGGYQFPLASAVFFAGTQTKERSLGSLYALDLLGACLGAVLLSSYVIPVFGFLKTAALMAVVNLAPAALLAGSLRSSEGSQA